MQPKQEETETVDDVFRRKGLEAGNLKLNLSYRDKYLSVSRKKNEELAILNTQLLLKVKALPAL